MDVTLTPLPMKEAISFFKEKVMLGPAEFRKLSDEARLKAFAVSGIAKGAELETVFTSLLKAMEQGTPLETFKKECAAIFEKRGWTGEAAWRVDNIFRTNIQTAYNVGRYSQMMKVTATRPYWMYDAVNDRRTRPAHKAMDGKIFPAGHPVWNIWYPPNGFRCRCGVTSLSEAQVKAGGLTVETADPTYGLVDITNPKTGITTPPFSLMPDPGFSYHPGKAYWGGLTNTELEAEPVPLPLLKKADIPIMEVIKGRTLPIINPEDLMPAGLPPEEYVKRFLSEFGVNDIEGERTVHIPGADIVVPVNKYLFMDKRDMSWKVLKGGREQYMVPLAQTILDPLEVWLTPAEMSGQKYLTLNLIKIFQMGKEVAGFCVFSHTNKGWTASTAYMPKVDKPEELIMKYIETKRMGQLLFRKEMKQP